MHIAKCLVIALALFISACSTMIPESDTTPPTVELRISGPGIGTKSMSNPPTEVWTGTAGGQHIDLVAGTQYNFSLIVTDRGGVSRATLRLPADLTVTEVSPEGVTNTVDGLSRNLTIRGTREDPRTGLALSGRFETTAAGGLRFDFNAESSDFGGRAGTAPNQRFMRVEANIAAR